LQSARIEVVIPVNSIYTGIEDRDKELLEEDFFDAGASPEISFKSDSTVKTGLTKYKIIGVLTMRGITNPIELAAKYNW